MTARGYSSQAALVAAARARGIHLRPNTLCDALRAASPRLETLAKIAEVLNEPIWALFCEPTEYETFIAAQDPERPLNDLHARLQQLIRQHAGFARDLIDLQDEIEALRDEYREERPH